MKFCGIPTGIVIERKGVDWNTGTLMLCPLCIADKLHGQPKSPDYITLASTVFPIDCSSRKQLYRGRKRDQAFFQGTQPGRFH